MTGHFRMERSSGSLKTLLSAGSAIRPGQNTQDFTHHGPENPQAQRLHNSSEQPVPPLGPSLGGKVWKLLSYPVASCLV